MGPPRVEKEVRVTVEVEDRVEEDEEDDELELDDEDDCCTELEVEPLTSGVLYTK